MHQMYHQQQQQQQHGMPPQQPGFNSNASGSQAQLTQSVLPPNRMPPPLSHERMALLLAQLQAGTVAFSNNQFAPMMNSSGPAQGLEAASAALASATALAQAAAAAVSHLPMTRAPSGGYQQHGHSHNGFGPPPAHGPTPHQYAPPSGHYKPGVPSALRSFLVATAPNAPSLNSVHHMNAFQPSGRPTPARGARGRGRGAAGASTRGPTVNSGAAIRKRKPQWDGSDDSDSAAIATAVATAVTTFENAAPPAEAPVAPPMAMTTNTAATGRRKAKGVVGNPVSSMVELVPAAVKQEAGVAIAAGPLTSAAAAPPQLQPGKAASAKLARAARNKTVVVPIQVHQEFEEDSDIMLGCDQCQYTPIGCVACRSKPFATRPVARWQPKEGRAQQDIPAAPTYYPTAEEFKDPFAFIKSIRAEASKFGVCRIVPPAGWDPPFALDGHSTVVPSDGSGSTPTAAEVAAAAAAAEVLPEAFRFPSRRQFTSHLCMRGPTKGGNTACHAHAAGGRMGAVPSPKAPAAAGAQGSLPEPVPACVAHAASEAVAKQPQLAIAAQPATVLSTVQTVEAITVSAIPVESLALVSDGSEVSLPTLRQIFTSTRNAPLSAAGSTSPDVASVTDSALLHMVAAVFPNAPHPAVTTIGEAVPYGLATTCHPLLVNAVKHSSEEEEDEDFGSDAQGAGAAQRARARRSAVARELNALGMDLNSIDESVAAAVGAPPATSSRRRVASLKAQLAVENTLSGEDADQKMTDSFIKNEDDGSGVQASKKRSAKAVPAAVATALTMAAVPEAPLVLEEIGSGEGEDTFGFLSTERMHTLRSFSTYAAWAKALHFGLPLAAARRRNNDMLNSAAGGVVSAAKAAAAACLLSSAGDRAAAEAAAFATPGGISASAAAEAETSPAQVDSSCRPSSSEDHDEEMSDQPEAPGHEAADSADLTPASIAPAAEDTDAFAMQASEQGATEPLAALPQQSLTIPLDLVTQITTPAACADPACDTAAEDVAPSDIVDPLLMLEQLEPPSHASPTQASLSLALPQGTTAVLPGFEAEITDSAVATAAAAVSSVPAVPATPSSVAASAPKGPQTLSTLQAQVQIGHVEAALAAANAIKPAPPRVAPAVGNASPKQPPMTAAELAGIARSDIARKAANKRWANRGTVSGVPMKPCATASIAASAAAAVRRRTPPASSPPPPAITLHADKKARATLAGAAGNITSGRNAGAGSGTVSPHGTRAAKSESAKEPCVEEIEAEFWRIVERPEQGHPVETLYGSDLDSAKCGSGFPLPPWRGVPTDSVAAGAVQQAMDEKATEYSTHPWNVNNMPYNKDSALRYMDVDDLITGVMVPWLYVGSCLSAFCWHIEDHSLYSINYLHMGAHKVWYSVPADAAEKFEAAMHDALPHLFQEDPQLLHRLVTMLSPSELKARGVPVHRVVHEAGSFVITFPNAYHSGFNCGFNCAEAVNFAPADWLPFGGNVMGKYRAQAKSNTFSFDRLLIRMVSAAPLVHEAHALAAAQLAASSSPGLTNGDQHATPSSCSPPQESNAEAPGNQTLEACTGASPVERQEQNVQSRSVSDSAGIVASGGEALHKDSSSPEAPDPETGSEPRSWRAEVTLTDIPAPVIAQAAGELAVRLEEERRRQRVAREAGVTKVRAMEGTKTGYDADGGYVNTDDCDCESCKCDLFLSSVISPLRLGVAVCPEHVAALGVPVDSCILLLRHTIEELQECVDTAVTLFPTSAACITDAHSRVSTRREQAALMSQINAIGPLDIWTGIGAGQATTPAAPAAANAANTTTARANSASEKALIAAALRTNTLIAMETAHRTASGTVPQLTAQQQLHSAAANGKATANGPRPFNDEAMGLRLTHVSAPLQLQLPPLLQQQPHHRVSPSPAPPVTLPASTTPHAPSAAMLKPTLTAPPSSSKPRPSPAAPASRKRNKSRFSSSEEDGSGGEGGDSDEDGAGEGDDAEWSGPATTKQPPSKRVRVASHKKKDHESVGAKRQAPAPAERPASGRTAATGKKATAAAKNPAPAHKPASVSHKARVVSTGESLHAQQVHAAPLAPPSAPTCAVTAPDVVMTDAVAPDEDFLEQVVAALNKTSPYVTTPPCPTIDTTEAPAAAPTAVAPVSHVAAVLSETTASPAVVCPYPAATPVAVDQNNISNSHTLSSTGPSPRVVANPSPSATGLLPSGVTTFFMPTSSLQQAQARSYTPSA